MLAQAPHPFPARAVDAHKGSCGRVLVVAGSRGMSGAAYLAGKAALRGGAGLVTVACPASVNAALEVKTTCVMTAPLPETDAGSLASDALAPLRERIAAVDAVAIGPGLGQHPETAGLVRALLVEWPHDGPPLVVDADALNAFAGRPEDLATLGARGVLTPHPGELSRLAGESPTGERREPVLEAFVERLAVTTLLKGHRTLVLGPGDGALRRYTNTTGNPGMATAGSGDVLTGVIAGLLAQGLAAFEAACLGAYLHGRAGDLAARLRGQASLIASDLLDGLCEAIRAEELRT